MLVVLVLQHVKRRVAFGRRGRSAGGLEVDRLPQREGRGESDVDPTELKLVKKIKQTDAEEFSFRTLGPFGACRD